MVSFCLLWRHLPPTTFIPSRGSILKANHYHISAMCSRIIWPLYQTRGVFVFVSRNRYLSYGFYPSCLSFRAFCFERHRPQLIVEEHCSGIGGRWCIGGYRLDHSYAGGDRVFKLGLAADVYLCVGKAFTGYLSGSTAIMADAAHSLSDVVLSGIALLSYEVAKAPKDKGHPYGHGKFETLGALGISCMLLATSGGIAWHAFDILLEMLSPAPGVNQPLAFVDKCLRQNSHLDLDHPVLALSMMTVSICIKEGLYWSTKWAGEKTGSGLMKANAWHHRSDAVSSVVALVGVGGSFLGLKFLDPVAGLIVSGMILKAGLKTGYQSVMELVDAALPSHQLESIKKTTLEVQGVQGCHHVRGRRAGSYIYLDVHIEVDPFSSVIVGHDIGEKVRHHLCEVHRDISEAFIHIDPSTSHFLTDSKVMQYREAFFEQDKIEELVSRIFLSKFPKKEMMVESIQLNPLQGGRHLLRIQVSSLTQAATIGDAMGMADEIRAEVLKAVGPSPVARVSILLHLYSSSL